MQWSDLIPKLMSESELATSRLGIAVTSEGTNLSVSGCAETLQFDLRSPHVDGLACELIAADAGEESVTVLPSVFPRLTRDGILAASVPAHLVEATARALADVGADWVAALPPDEATSDAPRFVVAAMDIHPDEIGPPVTDHLAGEMRQTCIHLPQNRHDRARRRLVRRQGRNQMMALISRLLDEHGEAVRRVVTGIEILVGERPPGPNLTGRRPGMFSVPDLEVAPWPERERWPNLKRLMDLCERYAESVCEELIEWVASKSLPAYLPDEYNKEKFQLEDPDDWQALRLIDWRNPAPDLPERFSATREMLSEFAPFVSGEVNILRLAPGKSLPRHYDDSDYEQYIHFGLTVPPECGIRVAGEERVWEKGRPIVFTPAFLHEVWNRSTTPRDVLAIDIWHPDLTDLEIEALLQVRAELELLRQARRKEQQK